MIAVDREIWIKALDRAGFSAKDRAIKRAALRSIEHIEPKLHQEKKTELNIEAD